MAKFSVNQRASIDIIDIGNVYVASIWLYEMQHQLGPYSSRKSTLSAVHDYIDDLRFVAGIKDIQQEDLLSLQKCLQNLSNH